MQILWDIFIWSYSKHEFLLEFYCASIHILKVITGYLCFDEPVYKWNGDLPPFLYLIIHKSQIMK